MAKLDKNKWLSSDTFEFRKDKDGNHLAIRSEIPNETSQDKTILEEDMKTSFQFPELCSEILKERAKLIKQVQEKAWGYKDAEEKGILWQKKCDLESDEFLVNLAIQKATEKVEKIIDDQVIVLQNGLYEISRKSSVSPTEAIKQTEKINCYHFEIERLKALKQKFVKGGKKG